jgi:mRNA-degrading endonuclease toxin of MazEF toxin-antitoxin module
MKRGQIYFINKNNCLGSGDTRASRPAVIVSADEMIDDRDTVQVVYLTTRPQGSLPTHVEIESTGTLSVALCEMCVLVDKTAVGDLFAVCSAAEMEAIDKALAWALGLNVSDEKALPRDAIAPNLEAERLRGERDAYRDMLRHVLGQN